MLKSFKKINQLLDHKQKATMVFLVFVMLIGAVLEALGITLVLPIMQAIIDPESILENQYHMGDLYRLCGAESMKQFAVMMMIAIAIRAPSFGIEFMYCAVVTPRDGLFAIISIFLCT